MVFGPAGIVFVRSWVSSRVGILKGGDDKQKHRNHKNPPVWPSIIVGGCRLGIDRASIRGQPGSFGGAAEVGGTRRRRWIFMMANHTGSNKSSWTVNAATPWHGPSGWTMPRGSPSAGWRPWVGSPLRRLHWRPSSSSAPVPFASVVPRRGTCSPAPIPPRLGCLAARRRRGPWRGGF